MMLTTRTAPADPLADVRTDRVRWPFVGAAAGVLGAIGTLVTDVHPRDWNDRTTTADVVDDLSRATAHIGVIAGFATVALLLVAAAAWRRHVEGRVPSSTAARVVSNGLLASAAALSLGYGWKGALSVYLPGGMDAERFDRSALYSMYVLNDFGAYIGWLGVTVAGGAVAWMGFRERTVSRWIAGVSLVPVAAVTAFTVISGLPGFSGVVAPVWMIVAFTGLAFGRSTISR